MHGEFYSKSSTARLYTSRKERGKGLLDIGNVMRQEEQGLKSYVSWKAESDPLRADCKCLQSPGKSKMKLRLGIKRPCVMPCTKVCEK